MIRLVQNWISKEESRTPKPSQAKPLLPQAIPCIISQFGPCLQLWREFASASALACGCLSLQVQIPYRHLGPAQQLGRLQTNLGSFFPTGCDDPDSRTLVTDVLEVVWHAHEDCPWLQSPLLDVPRCWLGLLKQQCAMVTHCINKQLSQVYQEVTCLVVSSKLAFQFIFSVPVTI